MTVSFLDTSNNDQEAEGGRERQIAGTPPQKLLSCWDGRSLVSSKLQPFPHISSCCAEMLYVCIAFLHSRNAVYTYSIANKNKDKVCKSTSNSFGTSCCVMF